MAEESSMVFTPHLDQLYERELHELVLHVTKMADHAEYMVKDAVLALLSRDEQMVAKVIAADGHLDEMETHSDALCVRLMAKRAPVGADLRLVTSALKLVTDIERIGDLAVNIVKRSGEIKQLQLPAEVAALARAATDELGIALTALKTKDAALAHSLREKDTSTDACNREAFAHLLALASSGELTFDKVLAITSICRHLERIGDHSVNIAEMVVYMVEGKNIRHRKS